MPVFVDADLLQERDLLGLDNLLPLIGDLALGRGQTSLGLMDLLLHGGKLSLVGLDLLRQLYGLQALQVRDPLLVRLVLRLERRELALEIRDLPVQGAVLPFEFLDARLAAECHDRHLPQCAAMVLTADETTFVGRRNCILDCARCLSACLQKRSSNGAQRMARRHRSPVAPKKDSTVCAAPIRSGPALHRHGAMKPRVGRGQAAQDRPGASLREAS